MQLLVVAGSLGSGKTTFITGFAGLARKRGLSVAILVNEIGEVGIDNQYMRRLGLNIYELLGGCLCCTLAADLPLALKKLSTDYRPDLVIMEPSGAADPRNVTKGLETCAQRFSLQYRTMALLDPTRLHMFMEVITPLITAIISRADFVVIGKTDLASAEEMAYARDTAAQINPEAKVYLYSCQNDPDAGLMEALLP